MAGGATLAAAVTELAALPAGAFERLVASPDVLELRAMLAQNYLDEAEIDELNRIVVMFLDHAEDQTRRRKSIHMAEWPEKLDTFLAFNERRVLPGPGTRRRSEDGSGPIWILPSSARLYVPHWTWLDVFDARNGAALGTVGMW